MLPYNTCSAAFSRNGGGILRKTGGNTGAPQNSVVAGEARQVDLLVFGYACKVFRDDPKAWEIDQGKHLIPWMGDTNLKIDRYDVRGALSDLTPYEPPPGGYGNRLDYLSAEEQRAEQLCEEDRYFFLYNNEEEHYLQQEEDLKRLQQETTGSSYGRVGFQYDSLNGSEQHGPNINDDEQRNTISTGDDDTGQPYIMPKNLQVPISIHLPDTMKQHAIIEKTARFIAAQGIQMEILLKAKQSNNVQFEFLAQNGLLNPYYKYVLNAIKSGTYPPEEASTESDSTIQTEASLQNEQISQYTKPIITVPTIKYTPSANCAYTQLISKIKGVPLPDFLNEDANATMTNITTGTDSPTTPILLQYNEHIYVQAGEENNSNSNTNTQDLQEPQVEILKNSSALALAQDYSSDSETDEEEDKTPPKPEPILNFPIPVENLKNIIDKTATYVIKNGRQFEETLRTKSEERFTFLVPENEFYPYYMYKITGDPDAASKEQKARKAAAVAAALMSKKGLTAPVSFSIKTNDQAAASLPPALPQEPSDDDDDDEQSKKSDTNPSGTSANQQRSVPEHVQKAIQLVESQLMARNAQFAAVAAVTSNTNNSVTSSSSNQVLSARASSSQNSSISSGRSRFDLDYSAGSSKNQIKSTKTELERNAIYEQQQQNRQKELKKAEEKVKDKLAQIAREKLGGLISKDKQLQLERKRKAMAFLNQIKGTGSNSQDGIQSSVAENDLKKTENKDGNGNLSDSSETSVHSIPITSYGPEDDDDHDMTIDFPETRINSTTTASSKIDNEIKSTGATVLLSDDDDVQVISEEKLVPSSYSTQRHRYHDDRKRSHSSRVDKRVEEKVKKHKFSTQSDECSSSSDSAESSNLKYDQQRRSKSRHDEERYSSHKSKKSKKSSKSKKKRKHKSSSGRDRSPSTFSQISRSSRHSKHSRHRSRCRSRSESRSVSGESGSTTESQRYKLSLYELDEKVTYTPPASPRKSRTSNKTYNSSPRRKEKKRSHYDY